MIKLDSVSEQKEQGLKPCPFCGGEAALINTMAFGKSCILRLNRRSDND